MFFKMRSHSPTLFVFFDVDGVLNREGDWKNNIYINSFCIKVFGQLNKELRKIYKDIRYVMSSTWRVGIAKSGNDTKQIESLKTALAKENIVIYDSTPVSNKSRQEEILFYIRRNNVQDYVILDDDQSLFDDPSQICLYLTDYKTGLKESDIKRCIRFIRDRL